MRYIVLALLSILFIDQCKSTEQLTKSVSYEPFAVSYEDIENPAQATSQYDLLIVEPDNYSKAEVDSMKTAGNTVLGYISLGEVNKYRWYYPLMEEQGFLGINENWDSPYLDLADPKVRSIMLDQVLPNIMAKGFDGLFLDTIDDVAPYTERSHLQPYMLDIIRQMRERYSESVIIQNAGFFMLDQTHSYVDAVLIEDVATNYNFDLDRYNLQPIEEYKQKVETIRRLKSKYNKPFLIVDFALNEPLRNEAMGRLDTLDIPYFISTIELNDISKGISSGRN
jgi:uncharacterized protein (TIGR01370 family)